MTGRSLPVRWVAAPAIALLLGGCQVAPVAAPGLAAMVFDRVADRPASFASEPVTGGARVAPAAYPALATAGSSQTEDPAGDRVPPSVGPAMRATATPVPGRRGGSSGRADGQGDATMEPETYFMPPEGRPMPAEPGDAVPIPAQLVGLWSYFAPGRVPTTVEVIDGPPPVLHPSAVDPAAEAIGQASLTGRLNPPEADVMIMYCAPGRRSYPAVATAPDGTFRLAVNVDGPEEGVLVARPGEASARRALRAIHLVPGAVVEVPVLDLVLPATAAVDPPQPPAGLEVVERAVVAVVPTGAGAFPVSLWSSDAAPFDGPIAYPLPDVAQASRLVAIGSGGTSGSAMSAPVGERTPFMPPPDLASLAAPEAGATLAWPAVPGATLYTLRLTSPAAAAPLWEAAVRSPHAIVPPPVRLAPRMALEVVAWDVAGLTPYSVAGLRALRLPDGVPAQVGRRSWATRMFGPSIKP